MIDWNLMSKLFGRLDKDFVMSLPGANHNKVYDDEWPDREWEDRYNVHGFGYDIVYKAGPHDWELPGANKRHGILDREIMQHDYCIRKKIYLQGHSPPTEVLDAIPELEYFVNVYNEFEEAVSEKITCFSDQKNIQSYVKQLMLIEYSNNYVPPGKEHDYWHWNFEKFGLPHADESLGGLHLGESLSGFYIDDDMGRTFFAPSTEDTLWFWGQEAAYSGYTPTIHGVEYQNNSDGNNRYSAIFNLKTKRK